MYAAQSSPFTAPTGLQSPMVAGDVGRGYLSVSAQPDRVVQGNANAFANAVQDLLQVTGDRGRKAEG